MVVQASAVPRRPSHRPARPTWVDLMTAAIVSPIRFRWDARTCRGREETRAGRKQTRAGRKETRAGRKETRACRGRKETRTCRKQPDKRTTSQHRIRKKGKAAEEPDELAAAASAEQSGEAAPEGETAETLDNVKRARNEE